MEDSRALMIEIGGHGCFPVQSLAAARGDGKMCVPLLKGPGGEGLGRVLENLAIFLRYFFAAAIAAPVLRSNAARRRAG
jgi:hypothetical protein